LSHTYNNLKSRVSSGTAARNCAQRIPLVHCVRKHVEITRVIDFLKRGYVDDPVSRESTRRANNELGIPEGSTFFYAGRSFPEEGIRVAMLHGGAFDGDKAEENCFESKVKANNPGLMDCGARPFDSGGLVAKEPVKQLKLEWRKHAPVKDGKPDVKAYFDAHNVTEMEEWRIYFGLFLEDFFASPRDYWGGIPKKEIDSTTFRPEDSWRNWTFELHSKWEVPPGLAGDIVVDARLEYHFQNQAGFGGQPAMAPSVKKIGRFHQNPGKEADRTAKETALSK